MIVRIVVASLLMMAPVTIAAVSIRNRHAARPTVMYCPSDSGLYVPCRDADRIRKREVSV